MFAPFDTCDTDTIAGLIGAFPLAWLVTGNFNATMLPLLAERSSEGMIVSLLGHCGRRNLIVDDLVADQRALVLFNGPSGYISPCLVSEQNWGPTWNYAAVRLTVDVEFVEAETAHAIDRLLDHMEGSAADRWRTEHLGERYAGMLDRIIAFRAHVRDIRPTMKLGQDETQPLFDEIVAGLDDRTLAGWMQRLAGAR